MADSINISLANLQALVDRSIRNQELILQRLDMGNNLTTSTNPKTQQDLIWSHASATTMPNELLTLNVRQIISQQYQEINEYLDIIELPVIEHESDFLRLQRFIADIKSKRTVRGKGVNIVNIIFIINSLFCFKGTTHVNSKNTEKTRFYALLTHIMEKCFHPRYLFYSINFSFHH
jgi:hypothetical protein